MSKTDLELTEIAARWLGIIDWWTPEMGVGGKRFDPLHDMNDLMRVVERLMSENLEFNFGLNLGIDCTTDIKEFAIYDNKRSIVNAIKTGNYADFPRAILELVAELVKENKP